MERCQSESSVKVPETRTSSTSDLLDITMSPSALVSGHSFFRNGDCLPGYQKYADLNSFSRWGSKRISGFPKSSALRFCEQQRLSSSPGLVDLPLSETQDNVQTRCGNCSESSTSHAPERSCFNKLPLMIITFLLFLSLLGSAVTCVFLKQVIERCDDLEIKLNFARSTYTQGLHDSQEFCIPYAELVQGPFEEDNLLLINLTRKTVDGVVLSCGRTPSQVSVILDLFIGQTQKIKCAIANINSSGTPCTNITRPAGRPLGTQISAHLVAGLQEEYAIGQTYQPIRNWKLDNEATHISGMEIVNDRLQVLETGTYFVYSQVGFEIHYNSKEDIDIVTQTLYHHLNRYNTIYPNGGTQILAKGTATQSLEQVKGFGHYTSYVAITVRLNKGDQLYVIVSQAYISRDPKRTYVGAYKIY